MMFGVFPSGHPALGLLVKADSCHTRFVVNLTATINRLDPLVYQPKIAFMVIKTISVYVVNCNLRWEMLHYHVMKTLLGSTGASVGDSIAICSAPSVHLYQIKVFIIANLEFISR